MSGFDKPETIWSGVAGGGGISGKSWVVQKALDFTAAETADLLVAAAELQGVTLTKYNDANLVSADLVEGVGLQIESALGVGAGNIGGVSMPVTDLYGDFDEDEADAWIILRRTTGTMDDTGAERSGLILRGADLDTSGVDCRCEYGSVNDIRTDVGGITANTDVGADLEVLAFRLQGKLCSAWYAATWDDAIPTDPLTYLTRHNEPNMADGASSHVTGGEAIAQVLIATRDGTGSGDGFLETYLSLHYVQAE